MARISEYRAEAAVLMGGVIGLWQRGKAAVLMRVRAECAKCRERDYQPRPGAKEQLLRELMGSRTKPEALINYSPKLIVARR